MYETLYDLWTNRAINGMTEAMLDKAITKTWITTDQKTTIMAQ
jgi:hypothetical protein